MRRRGRTESVRVISALVAVSLTNVRSFSVSAPTRFPQGSASAALLVLQPQPPARTECVFGEGRDLGDLLAQQRQEGRLVVAVREDQEDEAAAWVEKLDHVLVG